MKRNLLPKTIEKLNNLQEAVDSKMIELRHAQSSLDNALKERDKKLKNHLQSREELQGALCAAGLKKWDLNSDI
jgi:predicted  nucleic acid-binding Zn-ribbon protein